LRRFNSFSGRQARLLALSGLVLLFLAYIAGAVVQSTRDARNFSNKESRFSKLTEGLQRSNQEKDASLVEFSIRNDELIRHLAALEASLATARVDNEIVAREDAFLNRNIAYGSIPNDITKNALVESVCALWKNDEKLHVRFESQPLEIAPADIAQGRVTADLQTLLVENFISLEPIQRIRLGDVVTAATPSSTGAKVIAHQPGTAALGAEPAFQSLQKQLSGVKILRSLKFADGARYDVPKPIAVAVQIRRECTPF